ncbi:MAG TPA: RDD family protein [Thioalkalivibrio sp.]|nr:RDD family protein [Thioalkalivibrio sp.]
MMHERRFDTQHAVETPEGIALRLATAGPVPRALAFGIDQLIRFGIYFALSFTLPWLGNFGIGILLILFFLVEWFYPVLFEVLNRGQTPGKAAMGLRVLHDDATPVNWGAAMSRNLLRAVDFLPLFYAFGLVSCLLNRDFKRLGDLVAGTVVVYATKRATAPQLPEAAPHTPPFALQQEEQQALLSFAERSPRLTQERAEELARLTGDLVANSPRPLDELQGMAAWIAGRRTPAGSSATETGNA